MAKKQSPVVSASSEVTGVVSNIDLRTFTQVYMDCAKLTVADAITIVMSQFVEVPGLPSVKESGFHRDCCLVLLGEAGITKTVSIRKAAEANGLAFTLVEFAGGEMADNLPINSLEEDPDHPGQHRKLTFGPLYRKPESPSGMGLALINEGLGADARQQQQIRSLLSNRQLMGVPIHPGWTFVMDSNPATNKYFTNRGLDNSIEHRMFCIPVEASYESAMRRWSGTPASCIPPKLPSEKDLKKVELTPWGINTRVYDFLRVNSPYFYCGFDRRWEMFSLVYSRMVASGIVSEPTINRFINMAWPNDVATAFQESLTKGDDPKYWPIRGDVLLKCSEAEFTKHKAVIEGWKDSETLNSMIGFTLLNVMDYLSTKVDTMTDAEANHLVEFGKFLTNDQIHNLVNISNFTNKANCEKMWAVMLAENRELLEDTVKVSKVAFESSTKKK